MSKKNGNGKIKRAAEYDKAKSLCSCGHTGEGTTSDHRDGFAPGYGPCKVKGCSCTKFSWVSFTPEFSKFMESTWK